jgi:hypothetical protein
MHHPSAIDGTENYFSFNLKPTNDNQNQHSKTFLSSITNILIKVDKPISLLKEYLVVVGKNSTGKFFHFGPKQ